MLLRRRYIGDRVRRLDLPLLDAQKAHKFATSCLEGHFAAFHLELYHAVAEPPRRRPCHPEGRGHETAHSLPCLSHANARRSEGNGRAASERYLQAGVRRYCKEQAKFERIVESRNPEPVSVQRLLEDLLQVLTDGGAAENFLRSVPCRHDYS